MRLQQLSGLMDKFEQQFADLDVRSSFMEGAMGQSAALTTPTVRACVCACGFMFF